MSKEVLSEEDFEIGLCDLISHISSELREFLTVERRYFGITKSYMNSINNALISMEGRLNEEQLVLCRRTLNTFKPIIVKEYKRLRERRLSSGDCCILIVQKLLNIIKTKNLRTNKKELGTLEKIYSKLFANIRNKAKYDSLHQLSSSINQLIDQPCLSNYESQLLNLVELEVEKKITESEPITKVDEWGETKLIEVSWKSY